MSLPQKQNLPSSYTQEWIEYDRLYKLGSQRSQTSNLSFTSASSGMTYTSNTGQEGILQQLQVTLNPYLISSSDYNLIDEHIQEINDIIETHKAEMANFLSDYEYQPSTVVSRQIRTTKASDTDIVKFKTDADIPEGAGITISLDDGATSLPLLKADGTTPVTKLKQGFHEVIADATFFTFVSKGDYNEGDVAVLRNYRLRALQTLQNGITHCSILGNFVFTEVNGSIYKHNIISDIVLPTNASGLIGYSGGSIAVHPHTEMATKILTRGQTQIGWFKGWNENLQEQWHKSIGMGAPNYYYPYTHQDYYAIPEGFLIVAESNHSSRSTLIIAINSNGDVIWGHENAYGVDVQIRPSKMAVDFANGYFYYGHPGANEVRCRRTSNNQVVRTLNVGGGVLGITVDESNGDVYVYVGNTVKVYNKDGIHLRDLAGTTAAQFWSRHVFKIIDDLMVFNHNNAAVLQRNKHTGALRQSLNLSFDAVRGNTATSADGNTLTLSNSSRSLIASLVREIELIV